MKLLILGASGAVGSQVLQQALSHPLINQVVAPSRHPLTPQPKLQNPISTFLTLDSTADYWQVDAVICALGTTRKQAGSKHEFLRVDRELPVDIARLTKSAGARTFVLNSSLGAKLGKNFYLNTKAEAENAIAQLHFDSLTFVRPSLINTARHPARLGEQMGLWLAALFRPLIPKRYRPVTPAAIARALITAAVEPKPGLTIIESEML